MALKAGDGAGSFGLFFSALLPIGVLHGVLGDLCKCNNPEYGQ